MHIVEIGGVGVDRVAGVDRHPHAIGTPDGQQRDHDRRAVGAIKRDRLLVLEPGGVECRRDPLGACLHLGKGQALACGDIDQRGARRIEIVTAIEIVD